MPGPAPPSPSQPLNLTHLAPATEPSSLPSHPRAFARDLPPACCSLSLTSHTASQGGIPFPAPHPGPHRGRRSSLTSTALTEPWSLRGVGLACLLSPAGLSAQGGHWASFSPCPLLLACAWRACLFTVDLGPSSLGSQRCWFSEGRKLEGARRTLPAPGASVGPGPAWAVAEGCRKHVPEGMA